MNHLPEVSTLSRVTRTESLGGSPRRDCDHRTRRETIRFEAGERRREEAKTDDYSVESFLEEAGALVREGGANSQTFEAIGGLLRRLGAQRDLFAEERLLGLHGSGASAATLGRGEDGALLMLARFPAEAPTPVHNHNSWGVACVIQGSDRYERWQRLDAGSDPGRANLRMIDEQILSVGDVVYFDAPPHDIHRQQGNGVDAWELVYFGQDPDRKPRSYFDPDTGTVTHASAR